MTNRFPEMPGIPGISLSAIGAEIKYVGRSDLMLVKFNPSASVAGVFTRSTTAGASVDWCRACLQGGVANGLIVNSGNANTFTGKVGRQHVEAIADQVASEFNCEPNTVFIAATGVIGETLPIDRVLNSVEPLHLSLAENKWEDASQAILTTDTFAKGVTRTVSEGDYKFTINGFAKGSGMIAPDMATMLAFLFTDAPLSSSQLQVVLERVNQKSFNSITVDSDTSTSDTVLLFGVDESQSHPEVSDAYLQCFESVLEEVMIDLAKQVVKDGEGASKLITIDVTGAVSDDSARKLGLSIANSPLVKTAIAGEDANWGRIVMAVGKAGEPADRDLLKIALGGVIITENGQRVEGYDETVLDMHLKESEIAIAVDLGLGDGVARVWTCDFTHEYISINADYRS